MQYAKQFSQVPAILSQYYPVGHLAIHCVLFYDRAYPEEHAIHDDELPQV